MVVALLTNPGAFPKSFPKTPAPYKGAAGNFGKGGPGQKRRISGKTGNFGNPRHAGSALARKDIESLGGDCCRGEAKRD